VIAIETLRDEASRLPLEERAAFASFVLQTLPCPDHRVSDAEVAQRLLDLQTGKEPGLSTDQLFEEIAAKLR